MSRPVLAGLLEPASEAALRADPTLDVADTTAISIAISLKRIADSLQIGQAGPTTVGDVLLSIADRMPS